MSVVRARARAFKIVEDNDETVPVYNIRPQGKSININPGRENNNNISCTRYKYC